MERPAVTWGLGDFFWVYFGGILAGLVLATIGFAITGDDAASPGALTDGPQLPGPVRRVGGDLVLVSRRKGRGTLRADFGFAVQLRDAWVIAVGVALEIALVLLVYPLVNLARNQHQDVVKELQDSRGVKLALIALVAGLIAPVCEELLFRGLLLRALRRRTTPVAAVAISALVFALAHPLLDPALGTLGRRAGALRHGRRFGRDGAAHGQSLAVDLPAHRLQPAHHGRRRVGRRAPVGEKSRKRLQMPAADADNPPRVIRQGGHQCTLAPVVQKAR